MSQNFKDGCDICLGCSLVEEIRQPCRYYSFEQKPGFNYGFNYEVGMYILLGCCVTLVILYTSIITCKCGRKSNRVDMGNQVDVGNPADVEAPATPPILPILPPSTPDLNESITCGRAALEHLNRFGFSSSDEEI